MAQFENNSALQSDWDEMQSDGIEILGLISNNTYVLKVPSDVFNKTYDSMKWFDILEPKRRLQADELF